MTAMPNAPLPQDRPLTTAPSFRQQVLENLRDRIMSGELAPGTALTPTAVAKQLDTSAMPVREAIRMLEQDGLVEVADRRYTRVAMPSRRVADEAYPLLWMLEAHAVRQAGALPAATLADAEEANTALAGASGLVERLRSVFRFHRSICAGAGPITRQMLDMLYARVGLLESVYHRAYEVTGASGEHAEILAAIRVGDVETAASLTERHWRQGYTAILPFIGDGDRTD